jgi:hypothetical protein
LQQKTAAKRRPGSLSIGKQWTFPGLPPPLVDNFVNKELETYGNFLAAPFLQGAARRKAEEKPLGINELIQNLQHCTFPQAILLPK